MRQIDRRVVLGAAIALVAGMRVAGAQPGPGMPGPGGMGPGMGMGMGMGAGRGMGGGPGFGRGINDPVSYLANLKAELGITPAQEAAWQTYAETVQSTASQMQAMHANMFQTMGTASPQDRRDMMNTMFESRQVAFNTVHDAAEKLLPSLTPEQTAKAATTLPGLMGPGPGGGPGQRFRTQ